MEKSQEQRTDILGRPMIGVREEEDLFGETEKEHLMRWVKQQGNVVLMKAREDIFR